VPNVGCSGSSNDLSSDSSRASFISDLKSDTNSSNMVWNGGVLIRFSRSFLRESRNLTRFITIPNIIFFPSPHPCSKFWRIPLPGQQSNPASRQHFPESRNVFWSNPETGKCPLPYPTQTLFPLCPFK